MPQLNGKRYQYKNYTPGGAITSLDELVKQQFIFWNDMLYHRGWFCSWQIEWADAELRCHKLRYAIKKEDKDA